MNKQKPIDYHKRDSGFSTGFFWGLVLGGAGVFLFCTKQGKKIKKFLSENGEQLIDELEDIYQKSEVKKTVSQHLKLPSPKPLKKSEEPLIKASPEKKKKKEAAKELSHISDLQKRGRKAAKQFFTRAGKSLK